jgi:hypothetical protein
MYIIVSFKQNFTEDSVQVIQGVMRLRSWLRHYATSWKVAGSNPDEAIRFFNSPSPSSRPMVLRSTQTLTEMSTRNLPGG